MSVFSFVKAGKKVFDTIKSVRPAVGSLTKRRKDTDEVFGVRSRHGVTPNKKTGETVKKISKINDKLDKLGPSSSNPKRPGKKDGGRMGLKRGTGLMKKKSNVQKIKETFGPKNKSTKFGMLSVKAGIDKNPNPTQADRIAGAKMKSKKRFV